MDNVEKLYEIAEMNNMDREDIINLFLNYHGTQLLSDDFFEFIEDEGYTVD